MKPNRAPGGRLHLVGLAMLASQPNFAAGQGTEATLPAVVVREAPSFAEQNQVPGTTESVTAAQIAATINAKSIEDAFKYLPGLIVRKRNAADQFAPLATRTSGLGQSARSLVYVDGVLLSTLTGNNNSNATPRWNMVTPAEVERIDVMYGPYSAAYPGNSMGAVVEMTTRMPKAFEATVNAQATAQDFGLYGTSATYRTTQFGAMLGSRHEGLSWRINANHLDSQSQPLTFVTLARPAAPSGAGVPVTGAYLDTNRLGAPIAVVGAGGLERSQQDTFKFKAAYDFTPQWRASYALGIFQNDIRSGAQTYLRDAAGSPVYSGSVNIAGFNYTLPATAFSGSGGRYLWSQEHVSQSASLKSSQGGAWDWEAVASIFRYANDRQRVPGTALPTADSGGSGTIASLNGTGWTTLDLKGFWRPQGIAGAHQVSFGFHHDGYTLRNTTFATLDWIGGATGAITANSLGQTRAAAAWVQDAWRFAERFKLTAGLRGERWGASNGLNFSALPASNVAQPSISASKASPKIALAYEATKDWTITASYGAAHRFPTVSELYQAVTVGGVVFTPNPTLRPEAARSGELAMERIDDKTRLRVSLFQENLRDALMSQNATLAGTTTVGASAQNIDRIRSRGIEVVVQASDAYLRGLDLSGSVTWVDSKVVSDPGFRNAAGALVDVTGKGTPNIPRLKASGVATYRVDDHWSGSLGARYSSRTWATLDNTDANPSTFQGFDKYFVADVRLNYRLGRRTRASFGIDNLNNRKYFLFHPFPQRTAFAELRHAF